MDLAQHLTLPLSNNYSALDDVINVESTSILRSANCDPNVLSQFAVHSVPGDGHCFMHALSISMKHQLNISHNVKTLLCLLRKECTDHPGRYMPFIVNTGRSYDVFYTGMNNYIDFRLNESFFGDLIPLIMCNSLNVKINVLARGNNEFELFYVKPVHINQDPPQTVLVVKSDDHYDALVPQSTIGSPELNLSHVVHNVTSYNAIVSVPSNYEATSSKCAISNDAPVLSSDNNHQVNFKLPLYDKPSHQKSSSVHDNFISSVKRHKGL